jgi:5'-nucleotidase
MMIPEPFELSTARILVTNDDGIYAPGLAVLEQVARTLSEDVWVVAPETEQSGAGHSLTLLRPLRIHDLGPKRFAVNGTPTDCVMLAVNELMKGQRPTLLLSGVNRGANLGEDITYSGTVAAAMEGTLLEVPSIALSQVTLDGDEPRWATPMQHAAAVIRQLVLRAPWPKNTLMNVNFPDVDPDQVAGVRAVRQGQRRIGNNMVRNIDPRGRAYYWVGTARDDEASAPGTDIHTVNAGAIAVTPVYMDLTHDGALSELETIFP